jgi:hypothetical protein
LSGQRRRDCTAGIGRKYPRMAPSVLTCHTSAQWLTQWTDSLAPGQRQNLETDSAMLVQAEVGADREDGSLLVNPPIPWFTPGSGSRPTTFNPFHHAQMAHSFIPISRSGRTILMDRGTELLWGCSSPGLAGVGGDHCSSISSRTANPPPCDIDEMRATESDVREVPRRAWEHAMEEAVYSNSIRTKVRRLLATAVWVGRAEMYERSWSTGSASSSSVRETDRMRST